MVRILTLSFAFLFEITLLFSQDQPLVRYPSISEDGSKISFSYQGDIWVMPTDENSPATRLTIHEGYESVSFFSPSGDRIAFTSNRYGNDDIFILSMEGGSPRQLTYHSTGDVLTDWYDKDHLLFETRRVFGQVERTRELHTVHTEGGTPERLLDAMGFHAVASPNGRFIAFERGSCRIEREAYRGSANRDLWLYDSENDKYTQLTTDEGQDIYPSWKDDRTLYLLSARTGTYNIYRLSLNGNGEAQGSPVAVSEFKEDGIRYFDVAEKSGDFVFSRKDRIYLADARFSDVQPVEINIFTDYRFDPVEYKDISSGIEDFSVTPDGEYTAFSSNGEIFVKKNDKDVSRTVRVSHHPYRDNAPVWLNDSTLLFLSDRSGVRQIYLARSAEGQNTNMFAALKLEVVQLTKSREDISDLTVAPDQMRIAYTEGDGRLITAVMNEGELEDPTVLLDGWASPGGVSFSPDSKWLAYSLDDLNFNEEVYIHPVDNSRDPVNVSMHPRGDYQPVWSRDGSKLGFISSRNNGDNDVWFVWLKKEDWEKTRVDWEDIEALGDELSGASKNGKDSADVVVEIDFEDIYQRLSQVTSLPGNESGLAISEDGETFFFTTNRDGRQSYNADSEIFKAKWDGSELEPLVEGDERASGLVLGPQGKKLFYTKGGRLVQLTTEGKKTSLPFQTSMKINHFETSQQVFNEAVRVLGARFYDPNFHGQNWERLVKKYKPWALKASTREDFRAMFNAMLGQINASHMGLYGGSRAETQSVRTGFLGIETRYDDGLYITSVVPESSADKTESRLQAGDRILSINGTEIEEQTNIYELLVNQNNERVILEVESNGNEREVVIRAVSSLRRELYDAWVEQRRALTDEYSNGQLGYLHIQGMNWTSFERFERELTAAGEGKKGIVIDVRFNGGGWTTDYLMTVLNVRQHAYTIPRGAAEDLQRENKEFKQHYPFGERLPLSSWTRPSIALCNQNSYSNAEIFSHAYKELGVGTLVGTPTFGAVISTGGFGLMDGSYVRLPFRAWYVYATETNMELNGAVPDVIVENQPDSKANNRDEQLMKAVEILLEQIP